MADDNRLDLSADLEKLSADLLKDVKAASNEVKDRQAAIKAQEQRDSNKAKTRKTQMLMVAVGAVVILLLSYWMVFARPDATSNAGMAGGTSGQKPAAITAPATQTSAPSTATSQPSVSTQSGTGSQVVEHPSDEYETPNGDGGM